MIFFSFVRSKDSVAEKTDLGPFENSRKHVFYMTGLIFQSCVNGSSEENFRCMNE